MKKFTNLRWLIMSLLLAVGASAWGDEVTYLVNSKNTLTVEGTAPTGSSATLVETYKTSQQMTSGNSQTLTLSGYNGCTISNISLEMHSNKSSGAGKLSYSTDGGTTFTYIVGSSNSGPAFNDTNWNSAWSQAWVTISKDVNITASSSNLIIKIEATTNSLYCKSYTLTYTQNGASVAASTTTTIDASSITNTDIYAGTAAGSLSATVKDASNNTITGATVTWSSSNEDVATIDNNGTVTLVGTGTTDITATFAGVTNQYQASSATYELTVTRSTVVIPIGENEVLWSEDFSSFSANAVPSSGENATYVCNNGGGTTKVYDEALAGGTAPELLIAKSNGSFTVTITSMRSWTGDLQLTFNSNKTSGFTVTSTTSGVTITKDETSGTNLYTISGATDGFTLVFTNTSSANARFDDFVLTTFINKTDAGIAYNPTSETITKGDAWTAPDFVNTNNLTLATYQSSNTNILTVAADGTVTLAADPYLGTATVTVTTDGTSTLNAGVATYTLKVVGQNPELSFATSTAEYTTDNYSEFTGLTLTNPHSLNVTWKSDNESVATVDANGIVTLTGIAGSAKITATYTQADDGNCTYKTGSANYTVSVTKIIDGSSTTYVKVTSEEELELNQEYIIVYETTPAAMGAIDSYGSWVTGFTIDDETISITDEAVNDLTLVAGNSTGSYSFLSALESAYLSWSSGNSLTTSSDIDNASSWTLSYSNGSFTIANVGTTERKLQANASASRFACYTSTQGKVALYKKSGTIAVKAPIITPSTGVYDAIQTVSMTCATAGATIYYTTNGSNPTTSSTQYTGTFTINKSSVVKAIAVKEGNTSSVSEKDIAIINTPVLSDNSNTFTSEYQVTISQPTGLDGLSIYYITQDNKIFKSATGTTATKSDASTDSDGNPILVSTALNYSSALTFGQSIMVTAVCVDIFGNVSDPVTLKYTYSGSIVPPYFSSFSASEGDFTKDNETDTNTMTTYGAPVWVMGQNTGSEAIANWGEERYYMKVMGTSANTNQTRDRYYGTAYLTSPIIDLTGKGNASFSFIHAGHHFYADPNETPSNSASASNTTELEKILDNSTATTGAIRTSCKVEVGVCDANGNVTDWDDLSADVNWFIQKFNANKVGNANLNSDETQIINTNVTSRSGSFPRSNSGDISLSAYENQTIRIRFAYTSTPQSYGTWNIDQVTVNAVNVEEMTMNSKGWTTYVFDHDIDAYQTTLNYISGDEETLQIYKVTEFDKETCVLQQLGKFEEYSTSNNSERYIPAKTPVVIHGPASTQTETVVINFVEYNAPSMLPTVKNNLLIASLAPNTAKAPVGSGIRYFVLQWNNSTNQPWFNKVSEGREIPDHRAYLNGTDQCAAITTSSNPVKGIYVLGEEEEEATGIEIVENADKTVDNKFYNLAGQRVMNPTKGIYIVNGKKVFIK